MNFLNWTDGLEDKILEPDSSKKLSGWTLGERPNFKIMNWLFWNIDNWIKYLSNALYSYHLIQKNYLQSMHQMEISTLICQWRTLGSTIYL